MSSSKYFSKEEKKQIVDAIKKAETYTSGEIRVHIEMYCKEDVLDRSAWWFRKLSMHKTSQRNGVLIYLAFKSKKFAIIGDSGINKVVPPNFWEETKEQMALSFSENNFVKGLIEGILTSGSCLGAFFPSIENKLNEQPDEISFGK